MHYHYGYFEGSEGLEQGLRRTVRNFYPQIQDGATVLDVGCGWGGPGSMLVAEKGCRVEGVTISAGQAEDCRRRGLSVRRVDVEHEPFTVGCDVALFLESHEHLRDKVGVLERVREEAGRLIVSSTCVRDRRAQSIPTLSYWRENLERVCGQGPPPSGHAAVLRKLTAVALGNLAEWCQAFPLIDLVAD